MPIRVARRQWVRRGGLRGRPHYPRFPTTLPHHTSHQTSKNDPMATEEPKVHDNSHGGYRHWEAPEARGECEGKRAYRLACAASFRIACFENATSSLHACGGPDRFHPHMSITRWGLKSCVKNPQLDVRHSVNPFLDGFTAARAARFLRRASAGPESAEARDERYW